MKPSKPTHDPYSVDIPHPVIVRVNSGFLELYPIFGILIYQYRESFVSGSIHLLGCRLFLVLGIFRCFDIQGLIDDLLRCYRNM